jgi:transcriptional regulator with XRE-family HTH domain
LNHTGKLIKQSRKKQKITQKELADNINCSDVFISLIEKGECSLPGQHIGMVSKLLKLPKIKIIEAMKKDFALKVHKKIV